MPDLTTATWNVQIKIRALEKAFRHGILSDEEYRAKRAELEEEFVPSGEAGREEKLAALDGALQVGLITPEEYDRQREELLRGVGA